MDKRRDSEIVGNASELFEISKALCGIDNDLDGFARFFVVLKLVSSQENGESDLPLQAQGFPEFGIEWC